MSDEAQNTYDEVLYPGYPLSQTHPDRLATMATLFGLKPVPVERCRVLELGCGDGGNLVPMAFGLPESEFVGIDLAPRPIAKGQAMVEALGLRNITLRPLGIQALNSDYGQFDYIIAHGFYSWVPPDVRDKLMTICKENLAPQGIAYISYNTYPGGHLRDMVREMMLFHTRKYSEPEERIHEARAIITYLAESAPEADLYRAILEKELERITKYRDSSLYHDDLGEVNSPIYFYKFIEHAAQHGLQFLSEAVFQEMLDSFLSPQTTDVLRRLAEDDIVAKEQYRDLLKCRKFRQTLLCHQDVTLDRGLRPGDMTAFYAASPAQPLSPEPNLEPGAVEEFRGPHGGEMKTGHPLAKAAIRQLSETWPESLHFNELLARTRSRLGKRPDEDDDSVDQDALGLGEILLRTYAANLVELHVHRPRLVSEASERPVASALARWQIRNKMAVTTLRHTSLQIDDELGRRLLLLLDGTNDREALLNNLGMLSGWGEAMTHGDGDRGGDRREEGGNLPDKLEKKLAEVARLALLVE